MSGKTNRNEQANQRRALIEQQRKDQQVKERRRVIVGGGLVGLVLIGLVVAIVLGIQGEKRTPAVAGDQVLPLAVTAANGPTKTEAPVRKVPNKTGIEGVIAYDTTGYPGDGKAHAGALPHVHVNGPVIYSVLPPVGGDHNGAWMNAGVYTKPVPNERAVHDLEHGAIWITYRPNLPADQVAALERFVGKQSLIDENGNANRYITMSPWVDNTLPAPIVFSSWGYQLYIENPSDARMQKFVDTFRNSSTYTPEKGSSVDSVPVSVGGRAAIYGGKFANPAN